MKKIFTIIISIILVVLIGLGITGYYVEKDKADNKKEDIKTETQAEQVEEKLVVDINKLDISKIDGYTPGEKLNSEEQSVNTDENTVTVGGISLPYNIENKNMEILSIGQYSGKFLEDGSDTDKENILAIVVKNTSDKVIDYGEITMKISGKSGTLKFKVTNLKPGASALVMESSGEVEFNTHNKYIYIGSNSNTIKTISLKEDQIAITTKGNKITVENLTDKNINKVYVYYKTVSPGNCYLGGVTYRLKLQNVRSGKSVSAESRHFSNLSSEIIKVETVK